MQAVLVDDHSAVKRAKKYAEYVDYLLLDSAWLPILGSAQVV